MPPSAIGRPGDAHRTRSQVIQSRSTSKNSSFESSNIQKKKGPRSKSEKIDFQKEKLSACLEYWSTGVMGYGTPILHHSITPPLP
jgi:hypothetical protein